MLYDSSLYTPFSQFLENDYLKEFKDNVKQMIEKPEDATNMISTHPYENIYSNKMMTGKSFSKGTVLSPTEKDFKSKLGDNVP